VEDENRASPSGVGLLGAGAQAREIASWLPAGTECFYAVGAAFRPDAGLPWVDLDRPAPHEQDTPVVAAVGPPAVRRALVDAWPGTSFAQVVAGTAYVDQTCVLDEGVVVAPHAVLSVGVRIGAHTHVNIGATLSHDVHCGSFVTVSPGARVAGRVSIGDGAFLGLGSCVVNGVTLAPGVVVGAGAVVLHDVEEPNAVVAGNPARLLRVNEGWLDAL
jgi:sugar O-acyltransferase (sialic acid O-acetyltransferase NeuD family)